MRSGSYDRMFFVCYTPRGALPIDESEKLDVWAGDRLANAAVRAELFDRLIEKTT